MTNYFGGAEVAWAYRVLVTPAPEGGSYPLNILRRNMTVLLGILAARIVDCTPWDCFT
jgi:hypothetical protein